jgi:hypothetical protein
MYHAPLDEPPHPSKRKRSRDIARLIVLPSQHDELQAVCDQHGETQIVGVTSLALGATVVEVLCSESQVAARLSEVWLTHMSTSSRQPRS